MKSSSSPNSRLSSPWLRHICSSCLLASLTANLAAATKNSKRGFTYLGDTHAPDNSLLLSADSPLTWYYNWSPNPNTNIVPSNALEFTPLIHGLDDATNSQTASTINSLPSSSTHLLSFNEPDGSKSSGGSDISPDDAAKSYIANIVPYREGKAGSNRKWNISHPATTGSSAGLAWLQQFNASCYNIDKVNGCPADFIAAHWYGDFAGLASWLGTLNEFYNVNGSHDPPLKIWVTEIALPQQSDAATVAMMNQSLPYLDNQTYVEKYAWFGAFREKNANEWTGDSVALFDNDGGLTQLGALYLGGETNGFKEGEKGKGGAVSSAKANKGLLVSLVVATIALVSLW